MSFGHFCPIFRIVCSWHPIDSIQRSYWSSTKSVIEMCKSYFPIQIFPLQFWPPKQRFARQISLSCGHFWSWLGPSKERDLWQKSPQKRESTKKGTIWQKSHPKRAHKRKSLSKREPNSKNCRAKGESTNKRAIQGERHLKERGHSKERGYRQHTGHHNRRDDTPKHECFIPLAICACPQIWLYI